MAEPALAPRDIERPPAEVGRATGIDGGVGIRGQIPQQHHDWSRRERRRGVPAHSLWAEDWQLAPRQNSWLLCRPSGVLEERRQLLAVVVDVESGLTREAHPSAVDGAANGEGDDRRINV